MAYFIPAPTAFPTVPDYSSPAAVMGYNLTIASTTTFTLSAGYARALCNGFGIAYPGNVAGLPSSLTVDITDLGANGCYPVLISDIVTSDFTVYGVYVIGDSSGANTTAAVVATGNNFLPDGYDVFRRVGLVYIDDTTDTLISWSQSGNGNDKTYVLADPYVALSAGAATTFTAINLTSTDAPIMPDANVEVLLNVSITPNAADGYVCVEPGLLTAASVSPAQIFGSVAAKKNSATVSMTAMPNATTGVANIKYLVDNAGSASTINVIGFTDSLGASLF